MYKENVEKTERTISEMTPNTMQQQILAFTSQNFHQTLTEEQKLAMEILENHASDSNEREKSKIQNKQNSDGLSINNQKEQEI